MLLKKAWAVSLASAVAAFLFSCASTTTPLTPGLNTAKHHTSNGMKLLKLGKLDAALHEFFIATKLNPGFSSAYAGAGLIHGFKGNFDRGASSLARAFEYAATDEEKALFRVFLMRFYIVGRESLDKHWLAYVEHHFNEAISIVPNSSEPYFYMGLAYKMSSDFRRASEQFTKVIELDRGYVKEAEAEYEIIGKIKK
jgi:lipoprotein NlpI